MPKFLKNLFFPKDFFKKKVILCFLLFLILALFWPTKPVQARWTDIFSSVFLIGELIPGIKAGAVWIAEAIVTKFLQLFLLVAWGVLALGAAFLSWVVGFTLSGSISLTSPSPGPTGNPIIHIGWTLIRDFVNIGLILGLVYIGLATALRWAGFELKKVFPWFLIMALLINFTPVICGVVVDAANLITKFFLEGMVDWSRLNSVFSTQMGGAGEVVAEMGQVASYLVLTGFGFLAGFVLFLFGLLLLLRVVAIPILVILSPLAFLAYVFPQTRSYFTQWWNQLLQWSFIGAIGGFFLYLSGYALYLVETTDLYKFPTPDDPTGGTFGNLAPYSIALLFLIIGFFVTLRSSAMYANYAITAAKFVGKKAPKVVAKRGMRGVSGAAVGAKEGAKKAKEEGKGRIWGGVKGGLKGISSVQGREAGEEAFWHLLEKAHVVAPGFYERGRRKELGEYIKSVKELPDERLHEFVRRPILRPMDAKIQAVSLEELGRRGIIKEEERVYLRDAQKMGADISKVVKRKPSWLIEIGESFEELGEAIQKISPEDFRKNVQAEELRKLEIIAHLDAAKVREIGKEGSAAQKVNLQIGVAQHFDELITRIDVLQRTEPNAAERLLNAMEETEGPNFIG